MGARRALPVRCSPSTGPACSKRRGVAFSTKKAGRPRDEVDGVGHTRDVAESVEKFPGRPRSQQPSPDYVGIKK